MINTTIKWYSLWLFSKKKKKNQNKIDRIDLKKVVDNNKNWKYKNTTLKVTMSLHVDWWNLSKFEEKIQLSSYITCCRPQK